jgi:hypothetical protein
MNDDPPEVEPEEMPHDDPRLEATRKLIAATEELRALLAPLTPSQRERVLDLARRLQHNPYEV